MLRTSDVQGQQRRLNDRENMTGYRRADIFMQRVGPVICSILMLICMVPGIVKGISSIVGVFQGKSNQPDNSRDQRYQRERHHQNRW